MIRIATLYSGSSGNSTVIDDNGKLYLVDVGGSCKRTVTALYALGLSPRDVSAVFITHEHSDHIGGLDIFLKYFSPTVFASAVTAQYINNYCALPSSVEIQSADAPVLIGETQISPFETPHDSRCCFGYRFDFDSGKSAAVATDLGRVTESVEQGLAGCSTVVLESNYDVQSLKYGPYPYRLKQRILSDFGHLSNDSCAQTAAMLAEGGMRRLILAHISKENNTPDLALTASLSALENIGAENDCAVFAAPRYEAGEFFEV